MNKVNCFLLTYSTGCFVFPLFSYISTHLAATADKQIYNQNSNKTKSLIDTIVISNNGYGWYKVYGHKTGLMILTV